MINQKFTGPQNKTIIFGKLCPKDDEEEEHGKKKTSLFKIPEKLLSEDVQTHQKELWIAFQDIHKAFDSTSIDGLEIFLKHVDIPANVDM
ncbi:hypothetical protein RhiirA5_427251 [Rhizophagus irregularis]|uniref:Reverse transcriptase domain-containing protein n=1 Tax=Rhizophagus irregularis TaxID=588596 RepID=A0A2N0P2T1_9GLOM|nr:hypothetical protein RhiirA5_427251 [Rhizophagus irregularis]